MASVFRGSGSQIDRHCRRHFQCSVALGLGSHRQRLTWSLVPVLLSFAELHTPRQQCLMAPMKEPLPDLSACEASLITRLVALEKSLHSIGALHLHPDKR